MPYSRTTATAALAAAQLPKGSNSVVDLLTRVPVNRGSLVKSIENLLKTIESSENAVMIPTLLRDKVRVDAWELLFVAKILKASILGHGDLVEFYMNHLNSGEDQQLQEYHQQDHQQSQADAMLQQAGSHLARGQSSPQMAVSPQLQHSIIYENQSSASSSVASSVSSMATANSSSTATTTPATNGDQRGATTSSSSTASWATANANLSAPAPPGSSSSCNSNFTSTSSSSTSSTTTTTAASTTTNSSSSSADGSTPTQISNTSSNNLQNNNNDRENLLSAEFIGELANQTAQEALLAAKPYIAASVSSGSSLPASCGQQRQAQPPSLLQLTTTNNHINSLLQCGGGNSDNGQSPGSGGVENQLTISTNGNSSPMNPATAGLGANSVMANQQQQAATIRTHAELRTSRSAGCLFRSNSSGASSPKTPHAGGHTTGHTAPNTPLGHSNGLLNGLIPQTESLNGYLQQNGAQAGELPGDPSALVKLLIQIEQLKTSIAHVSGQLESVVELYKRSIDNIST